MHIAGGLAKNNTLLLSQIVRSYEKPRNFNMVQKNQKIVRESILFFKSQNKTSLSRCPTIWGRGMCKW